MRRTTSAVAAALLIMVVSRDIWLPFVGRFLIVADPVQLADALVPLAGDRSRVVDAAKLLKHGYARWFVITDMWIDDTSPALKYVELVKTQAAEQGVPENQIVVAPGAARTTYQEALNLRQLAKQRRWRSLIVVTSPYHCRRAQLILQEVFRDTEIDIIVRPVTDHWYSAENWWTTERGLQTTIEEYLKLALYLVGYHQFANR